MISSISKPPKRAIPTMSKIKKVLVHLLNEADGATAEDHNHSDCHGHHHHHQQIKDQLDDLEPSSHFRLLHQLLCVRQPQPRLPEDILHEIESLLQQQKSHRVLTLATSIRPTHTVKRANSPGVATRVSLWQGDITTLSDITAITNAANGQGLGCFQPSHRCIDNVIHSWAGPRLRDECRKIMVSRGREIEPGEAIVTAGFCLPAQHVVHTVGPQLEHGSPPTEKQTAQLAQCYRSVLDAVESLPPTSDGRKTVAFCGISTGLFAFPARDAAAVAVATVADWLGHHRGTSITDIIFNTFTDADHVIYRETLAANLPHLARIAEPVTPPDANHLHLGSPPPSAPIIQCDSLGLAKEWLRSADAVIVSAGAGLSASDGLDYTSPALFAKHFPGFLKYGLRTLYSVFGFNGWPNEQVRWGYFFTHLGVVSSWPKSPMYQTLISWLERFGPNAHVRTSNADGLFVANGLSPRKLSTPQGSYSVFQCLANCRPDATVLSAPLVDQAQSSLDPVSQIVTDPGKVPLCRFCGGKMNICVRAGRWFNERPFQEGESRWNQFQKDVVNRGNKETVILELGVGMSTPGVLRWPNEDIVVRSGGRVKLVRVGKGPETAVPWDLEDAGLATSIDGDISTVISELLTERES
ncbi:appr-1-p processing enzyme family protein [Colletotrichum truncatum]|uniref:Appr-1-p processing enzyme family protein n=1 Tax=Colletotrichum truncatum TaxID=5467 RepID=A0ACC3ZLS6_COLTU|nr:appr-1-p processing enzyme family protein [Colletotrichum truncatum]KAF6787021.1 appr-1-p processing enzyme family protein [Colletotrichum truncatum]